MVNSAAISIQEFRRSATEREGDCKVKKLNRLEQRMVELVNASSCLAPDKELMATLLTVKHEIHKLSKFHQ